MTKILLMIPAYNEAEGILAVVREVEDYIKSCSYALDYIVINDGSTDEEERLLIEHKIPHIALVQNLGIGGAVQTGYKYALEQGYDIAVQYDGDGQHDIQSLPHLIDPILSGRADFTVGSRFIDESPSSFKSSLARQTGIKFLSLVVRAVSGIRIKDITSGFRAANKKVIALFAERYPSKYPEPESYIYLVKQHIRILEVGANMFERQTGKSSINIWVAARYMFNVTVAILIAALVRGD